MAQQCHLACTWSFCGLCALSSGLQLSSGIITGKAKGLMTSVEGSFGEPFRGGVNVMRGLLQLHLAVHSTTDKILHRLTSHKCSRLISCVKFFAKFHTSLATEVPREIFISVVHRDSSVGIATRYWLDGSEFETR
jgi:hypothetical protein